MSIATILEAVEHEKDSCQPDEWLDTLIQVRDALDRQIERERTRRDVDGRDGYRSGGVWRIP